jgi:hypothetical protein
MMHSAATRLRKSWQGDMFSLARVRSYLDAERGGCVTDIPDTRWQTLPNHN